MYLAAPETSWVPADAIYETVHLARSEDHTSKHALFKRQFYSIDPSLQKGACPLIGSDNIGKEYFIVVDAVAEQGTTMASLISYITHNGGVVLAAIASSDNLVQRDSTPASDIKDPAKNTGRIPDIARAFSESARNDGLEYTPEQCIDLLEKKLNVCGNSLLSLTNGECKRLVYSIDRGELSFRDAMGAQIVDFYQQEMDAANDMDLKSSFQKQVVYFSRRVKKLARAMCTFTRKAPSPI